MKVAPILQEPVASNVPPMEAAPVLPREKKSTSKRYWQKKVKNGRKNYPEQSSPSRMLQEIVHPGCYKKATGRREAKEMVV